MDYILFFPSSVSKTELEGLVWVYSFVRKVTGIKTINYATFEKLPTKAQFIAISIFEKTSKRIQNSSRKISKNGRANLHLLG
jgi:hypothetical protein